MITLADGCAVCKDGAIRRIPAGSADALTCTSCGHLTMDLGPGAPELYDTHYAGFRPDPVFLESARRHLEPLAPLSEETARLLDIGCGNGTGMLAAAAAGFETHGIDTSAAAVQLCRERGLSAEVRHVDDPELGDDWDVATIWDVLEHIHRPEGFLSSVHARLRPGGTVLIKIPTVATRRARAVLRVAPRVGNVALQIPAHVNYFTPISLRRLLECTGFKVETETTVRSFRTRPSGGSVKRRFARTVIRSVMRLCRGQQLIVVARATSR